MQIKKIIILHTLLCSVTAVLIVLGFAKAFHNIQSEQQQFDKDLVILRDYNHLQEASKQWLTLSDLIIGSGETYLVNGASDLSDTLLELVVEIESYFTASETRTLTDSLKSIISKNKDRIKKTETMFFDEEQDAFDQLLDELDQDAGIFINALTELKQKLDSGIEQRDLELVAQRERLEFKTTIAGIAYLLIVFLSWRWQTSLLVKPIQNLTFAARKALDEDDHIELQEAGSLEVRELTHHLHQFAGNLETKIKERTVELQQRQQELVIENKNRKNAEVQALDAQKQAEIASEAKSDFLATMSHEIRTPMNGVVGMTDILLGTKLTSKQKHLASTVMSSANSLRAIINDILDFSKIQAGKLQIEQKAFNLHSMLEELSSIMANSFQSKGLEYLCIIDEDVPEYLIGDEYRIRQILINLLGNANKFTSEGEVVLHIESVGSNTKNDQSLAQIRFSIKDTGVGIREENLDKIFQMFSQADGSTTREFGGTGLGLNICNQLLDLMDSKIQLDSIYGEGSTFHFTLGLPIDSQNTNNNKTAYDLKDLRILAIDANKFSLNVINSIVEQAGASCDCSQNKNEALQYLDQAILSGQNYDLILLDHHMPEIDGIMLAKEIKNIPELSVPTMILLCSANEEPAHEQLIATGIKTCFHKPLFKESLLEQISQVNNTSHSSKHVEVSLSTPKTPSIESEEITHEKEPKQFSGEILVAEDNPVNQQIIDLLLEELGFDVSLVENGQQAVDLASKRNFDLIFMDCQMPVMDGITATKEIRSKQIMNKNGYEIPIIALTANAMEGDRENCLAAGMTHYLSKPYNRSELVNILEEALLEKQETDCA